VDEYKALTGGTTKCTQVVALADCGHGIG